MENTLSPIIQWSLLAISFIGVICLIVGVRRFMRRKLISGSGLGLIGILLMTTAGLTGVILLNLFTYQRLTQEQAVAELTFQRLGDRHYLVDLKQSNGENKSFDLRGDEWQLDARILKWQGLATLIALDPLYRLERISGRYQDVEQERSSPHSAYDISTNVGLDLWLFVREHRQWVPWIDATYGSATYMPMVNHARYSIHMTNTGLIARPLNKEAEEALLGWK